MGAAPGDRAETLRRSAQSHRDAGDLPAALRDQSEAVTLLRDAGDPQRLGHALRHLADLFVEIGLADQASPLLREMLGCYRVAPDTPPLEMANAVRSLAVHREALGQHQAALDLWQQARDRYRALDAVLREMTGSEQNPGVAEAEARIARLTGG